ncbi:hypothetical protein LWI29_023681 [Acer saccharum]|uniref:WRKY domain-containing protein n=1 Tax=Acer saccharum TaxID=4024 RepID=A0AA39SFY3_ACESA|nr:hypothetical protein LWI29_023681 [Acer saccharum]
MTLYDAFFIEKGIWNRLTAVEIVFSFTQMIVAYIDLVVKIIPVKINYNYKASAFPLGFAIIVLVYAFKSNEKSPPTDQPTITDPVESSASRKWSDLPGKQTQSMVADSDLPVSSISIDENPKSDGFDGVSMDNLVDKKDGLKKRKPMARSTKIVKEGAEDGYSWRKYGQKDIVGAKHPRSYYRCAYRNTMNCWATKQMQRLDEDPTMLEVTYRGVHTCTSESGPSQEIIDE